MKEQLTLGRWDRKELGRMVRAASVIRSIPERIDALSRAFLGIPYRESTLIGSPFEAETFVVNLESVDCFTFIDYVEAMRLSASFEGFCDNLKKVRYRHGIVSYATRMHFFTDWLDTSRVKDVTFEVGGEKIQAVTKTMNRKSDGSSFVPGIPEKERRFAFIPSSLFDEAVIGRLRTGDYGGIYAEAEGLDVSHVGIIVAEEGRLLFRHASSIERRVLDEDLLAYLTGKPGIVVLRPCGS